MPLSKHAFLYLLAPACSLQLWPRRHTAQRRVWKPHGSCSGDSGGSVPVQGERGGRPLRPLQGEPLRAEWQWPPGLPAYVEHCFCSSCQSISKGWRYLNVQMHMLTQTLSSLQNTQLPTVILCQGHVPGKACEKSKDYQDRKYVKSLAEHVVFYNRLGCC